MNRNPWHPKTESYQDLIDREMTCICGSNPIKYSTTRDRDICPSCFLDRHAELHHVAYLEINGDATEKLVVAADTRTKTDSIKQEVIGNAPVSLEAAETKSIKESLHRQGNNDEMKRYLLDLSLGVKAESRFIYTNATPNGSAIDTRSHVSSQTRRDLWDSMLKEIIHSKFYGQIKRRKEIDTALSSLYPELHRHRATKGLNSSIWRHVKTHSPEQLAESTKRSKRNQELGRGFEEFFKELCNKRGYIPHQNTAQAMKEKHPGDYRYLRTKLGTMKGIPDFFVQVPSSSALVEDAWQPSSDCFVEVKHGDSKLSSHQKRFIPYLKQRGYEVYVLRGTPDNHVFTKR